MPFTSKKEYVEYKQTLVNQKRKICEDYVRLLYNNLTEHFISGDIIITGSVYYEKVGLIDGHNDWKDLDISVNTGERGDIILNELINFFSGMSGCSQYNSNNTLCIKTSDIVIDVFREDFAEYNGNLFEIFKDIYSMDYGLKKVITSILYVYDWFDENKLDTAYGRKKMNKIKDMLRMIYFNKHHEINNINDVHLINKLKEIIKVK